MREYRRAFRLSIAALIASAGWLAGGAVLAQSQASPEEVATVRTLMEAHAAMGNLRALPGGCNAAGLGVVELASIFREAELPAPKSVTQDGWGRPLMAWCTATEWAVISTGADGLLAAAYGALPAVGSSGDDFVLLNDDRYYAPERILRLTQEGKQKKTMADLRSIATVFEAYLIDNDALPGAPTTGFVAVESIRNAVQPIYIRELPTEDAWGNPIWIWHDGTSYRIVSAGRDGTVQADYTTTAGAGVTHEFNADIVMGDGQFLQWPEGDQR